MNVCFYCVCSVGVVLGVVSKSVVVMMCWWWVACVIVALVDRNVAVLILLDGFIFMVRIGEVFSWFIMSECPMLFLNFFVLR